ncbi:hypothetical protein [Micromonospora sp. NPDC005710]|uniref:hypothetical protein n=1 Tax=Micromonospora sp. NPDC005710 TaxID=3157051 RepID=UPI00340452A4
MTHPNGYAIAERLAVAPYAEAPTIAGRDPRENLLLRMYHALEASGLVVDVTSDRDAHGHCRFCSQLRGEPHDERCPVPRCVVTGHQRLVCEQKHKDDHDCGVSLWAAEDD